MSTDVERSFAFCRDLTRRTAGNFYYAFLTLPQRRFLDTCALYAFMRLADDIGDDVSIPVDERRVRLSEWHVGLRSALDGGACAHECLPALVDVVQRHGIPPVRLFDVVTGIESDLEVREFRTFAELEKYCYHVAGAVGVCCVHVWGLSDERGVDSAIDCGLAFQLTNILRDVGEDVGMDRVYLPLEDLERFGYSKADLRNRVRDERFRALMGFEVERARDYYARSARLFEYTTEDARPILSAMIRIYRSVLDEIERRDFDVFDQRIGLSTMRKLWISFDTLVRGWWSSRRTRRLRTSRPAP